ncbi:MAG: hypothetical protein NZ933_01155 [Bacteroidia bacterium]|nr:hypothetical protein [Bacteroidia bacterium]MDW8014984.1 hypothetical protein [Bacteroidia bacterium]
MAGCDVGRFSLPEVYYHWLERVQRYPMFDVLKEGVLCSIRLCYILKPCSGGRDIFLHQERLRKKFPPTYLPLGYDAFGNLLLWDMESGGVYLYWKDTSSENCMKVFSSLESLCESLYYRPIH